MNTYKDRYPALAADSLKSDRLLVHGKSTVTNRRRGVDSIALMPIDAELHHAVADSARFHIKQTRSAVVARHDTASLAQNRQNVATLNRGQRSQVRFSGRRLQR